MNASACSSSFDAETLEFRRAITHLDLYWLYDLPNWIFGGLVVAFLTLCGLPGLFTTRKWVRRQHREDHSRNDIVSYFLAAPIDSRCPINNHDIAKGE